MTATKDGAPKRAKKRRRSTNVPGQLYGYLLQVTRSVAHLLRARAGQAVSVEHLDDVATEGPDGIVAEQDKSGLAHNPVADRSIELWKTLHNWVRAIRDGALKSDTKFILYVAQDHHGNVIDRIHAVTNKADADALVQCARVPPAAHRRPQSCSTAVARRTRVHHSASARTRRRETPRESADGWR